MPGVSLDPLSFVFGLAVASIMWWGISRSRPLLRELRADVGRRRSQAQARRMSVAEENYRRETLRRAEGMHLAAALFPLGEVAQEPRLLAPPAVIEPGSRTISEDTVSLTVPYTPGWPEMGAVYHAPTLELGQALAGGAHIVIIGQPGAGKTVALAWLAILAANHSESLGALRDAVPFLLHVSDLNLPTRNANEALDRSIEMALEHVAVLEEGRTVSFVEDCFRSGRCLLLLDGFDELTSQGQRDASEYLGLLLHAFPKIRIVTTGAPEQLDGLIGLGFAPMDLAAWDGGRQSRFLRRWVSLWAEVAQVHSGQPAEIDPLLLESWLDCHNPSHTPLELCLLAWSATAGDGAGPHVLDAIAAHVRRLAPDSAPMEALETLAMQVNLTSQPVFDPRRARSWIKDFELPEEINAEGSAGGRGGATTSTTSQTSRRAGRISRTTVPTPGLVGRLTVSGLVVGCRHGRARFVHPVLAGYLAGRALSNFKAENTLVNQADWVGKSLTSRYFAAHGDVTVLLDRLLGWSRLPMHRPMLTAGRWLRDAPAHAPWRGRLITALENLLQSDGLPLALRAQAVVALICSDDAAIPSLFRRLLESKSAEQQQLAALGSGAVRDERAVGTVAALLSAPSAAVSRAACLALSAIGTTRALEYVGQALLTGDESLRRAAAESLANDPEEGYAMLRDGASMEDIAVKRAAVYGLGRINEIWANELLQQLHDEDEQWIVRNAAAEVLESNSRPVDPRAPREATPPSETPWLIAFAGALGLGISPGTPAIDVLTAALTSRNSEERLAALAYLKRTPSDSVMRQMYGAMFGEDPELREAAFIALWEVGASGQKLPDPATLGFN
jgi:HEAT repeat protein